MQSASSRRQLKPHRKSSAPLLHDCKNKRRNWQRPRRRQRSNWGHHPVGPFFIERCVPARHLAQALACHFSASLRFFAASPPCVLLAIAMDYLIVLIAAMNSLFNTLVQSFVPLLFAGLAAGWLLITYSSMRVMPREVFLRLHVPGLAAGWLWP